jgi:hypothetical protein
MTERYSKRQGWDRLGKAWEGLGCILAPESDDDAGSTGLASIYFNSTQVQPFVKVRKFVQFLELTLPRSLCPYRIALQAHTFPGSCCLPPIEGGSPNTMAFSTIPQLSHFSDINL